MYNALIYSPGSGMALDLSQVKPMVRAYLEPPVTGSTWCLFSTPLVKADTLPSLGSMVLLALKCSSMKTNLPPVKSLLKSERYRRLV